VSCTWGLGVVLGLCALLSGCAHARREPPKNPAEPDAGESGQLAVYHEHATRPAAAALVFAAPVTANSSAPDLSRDDRQRSAFVGYPEGVMEFFYVRWDDRQLGGWGSGSGSSSGGGSGSNSGDRYERRAISEKVGVLFR
jgi:hypothetical protein